MLVYAAHIPHSPLLLPQIGKERSRLFKKIRGAIKTIAEDLYARKVDTVITITPNGEGQEQAYVVHFSPKFDIDFSRFGDFSTRSYALGDSYTAFKLRHILSRTHSIKSLTPRILDAASSVASLQLRYTESQLRIVPLTYALDRPEQLYSFGTLLRDSVEQCPQRIAIISLGDLARNRRKTAKETKDFDTLLANAIISHDTDSFINDCGTQADTFFVSGYRPLAILLGVLDDIAASSDVVEYEQPMGIGMMVARFQF